MVLKGEDPTKILVQCDCGCSGLQISSFEWSVGGEKEYYIYHMITSFSAEQRTGFDVFKRKIKIIWEILTTGFYRYNEISLNSKQFSEFKKAISEFE